MDRNKKKGQSTSRASRKPKKPVETPEAAEARKKQKELQEKIYNEKLSEEKMEARQPFKGTIGKPVPLVTNCARLALQKRDVHVYDVAIKHTQSGQEVEQNSLFRREVVWTCLRQHQDRHRLNQMIFDDNHCLITLNQIPDLQYVGKETSYPLDYNGAFGRYRLEVIVRYKGAIQLPDLLDGLNTESFLPLQIHVIQNAITQPEWWLNSEFRDYPDYSIWVVKGNCFVRTHLNYGHGGENLFSKLYGQGIADRLKMHTHMINGNMDLCQMLLLEKMVKLWSHLEVIKHKLCPNFELPLIQYYALVERREELSYEDLLELAKRRISLNVDQIKQFNTQLKGMKLKTIFEPQQRGTFEELSQENANYTPENRESVFQTYWRIHQIRLRFPYLPLVKLKGLPFKIPIELLKIADERTKVIDIRNKIMRNRICEAATIDPAAYHSEVSNLANRGILNYKAGEDNANPEYNPQMSAFGLSILDRDELGKMELIEVEGRKLPRVETFQYTKNEHESSEKGALEAAPSSTLIACTVNLRLSVDKRNFVQRLAFVAYEKGIEFENKENLICTQEDFDSINDVQEYIRKHKQQNPEKSLIFLFILGGAKEDTKETDILYSWIKLVGDNLEGVATQCINAKNLREMQNPGNSSEYSSMIKSMVGKMNVKLGGVMDKIMEDARSECNKVFAKYTTADSPSLFLGIFSTKPAKGETRKSIVSISFNINLEATRFISISQLADKGTDFFEELTNLFLRALTVFKEKVGQPPVNIFMFRGGITDNISKHVAEFEMEKFLEAWMQYEMNNSVHLPKINLHYLVVDRTHCLRFFRKYMEKILNIKPGTVIDTDIVAFGKTQFFLCSHETKQGTVRPACYTLSWYNEENVRPDPDDLQPLIYALCFLVQRSIKSVASPAPLHYARLASDRALYYLMANPDSENLDTHPDIQYTNYVN